MHSDDSAFDGYPDRRYNGSTHKKRLFQPWLANSNPSSADEYARCLEAGMPARILVVDDDPDTLRLLKLILERSGFQPLLAENGSAALGLMAEQMPDLVLCDILMPELNGYETLTAIRKNPCTSAVPVIMLSALGQERDLQKALTAGADDYIIKPFSLRPLLDKINAILVQEQAAG